MKTKLEKIQEVRDRISEMSRQQIEIYERLIEDIGFDHDYLWDYCFGFTEDDEYSKACLREIKKELNED
jgi:hypothetical protein